MTAKTPYRTGSEPERLSVYSESRQRTEQVLVRLTPDEKAEMQVACLRYGVASIPELLRACFTATEAFSAHHQMETTRG